MWNHLRNATVWLSLAVLASVALVPRPLEAQEQDTARKVTKRVPPVYSKVAQAARMAGTVKLQAVVSPEGNVKSVRTTGGNPIFVTSAEEAVKQWKFEVAKKETTESIVLKFERPL